MNTFKAYRYGNKVAIDGIAEYHQGELLTHYLNADFSTLEQKYLLSLEHEHKVLYPYGSRECDYNSAVYTVQDFFDYVEMLAANLPPYVTGAWQPEGGALFALLNTQPALFRAMGSDAADTERGSISYSPPLDGDLGGYGIGGSGVGHEERYRSKKAICAEPLDTAVCEISDFTPECFSDELEPTVIELNRRIKHLYDRYMTFAAGILRVRAYSEFLDGYIHEGNAFQDHSRMAEAYLNFHESLKTKCGLHVYHRFADSAEISVSHGVLEIEDGRGNKSPRLWEITEYNCIGPFLYTELFDGIQPGFLPKRCSHCGRYFLLTSGSTPDFCDEPLPGELGKTCRDVGSRRKYDEKVKSDPVWLAYQRAYKARYARVSKKKMTKSEFSEWSEKAILLRSKALDGDIPFDEFTAALKE